MVTRLKFFDIFDNENVNSIYMKTHNFTTKSNDSHLKEKNHSSTKKNLLEERILNDETIQTKQFIKSESIKFETENENKLKDLEEKLYFNNRDKKQIIEKLNDLNFEIREINIDIEVFEIYEKYYDLSERLKKIIEAETLNLSSEKKKGSKKKDNNTIMDCRVFEIRNNLQILLKNRQIENTLKKNHLDCKIKIRIDLINCLEKVVLQIQSTRKELERVKSILVYHYHNLLKFGKDIRNEGLCWMIKAIWRLDNDVMLSFLPNFLDEELIFYLFTFSKKDMLLSKKLLQMKDLLTKVSFRRKSRSHQKAIMQKKLNDKININEIDAEEGSDENKKNSSNYLKSFLHNKTNLSSGHHLNNILTLKNTEKKLNINQVKEFIELEDKIHIDQRVVKYLSSIKELEIQTEILKKELEHLKKSELARINKAFLLDDYSRRFGVTQDVIVAAITGEENKIEIINNQLKEQRDYYKNIEICRTFNFIESTKWAAKKSENFKKITLKKF